MIELDIELTLTVAGPFLSRSSGVGGYGVDVVALRDRNGFPLLPGSHVRGRIRDAMEELFPEQKETLIQPTLGPDVGLGVIGEDRDPRSGQSIRLHGPRIYPWFFGDFFTSAHQQRSPYDALITRIAIHEQTGAAESGAMLVAECAVPAGGEADFRGIVTLTAASRREASQHLNKFLRAARWVPSVGSFRSVGFGQVRNVQVTVKELRDWSSPSPTEMSAGAQVRTSEASLSQPSADLISAAIIRSPVRHEHQHSPAASRCLSLELEEPFCLGHQRRDRNVYRTFRHIPGAVVKGAVAHQLHRILGLPHRAPLKHHAKPGHWKNLCESFDKLRFLTGFAVPQESRFRPVARPLSLFKTNTDRVHDASCLPGPFLAKKAQNQAQAGDSSNFVAPAFAVDWKSDVTEGWDGNASEPYVELRLHTAIDPKTRRSRDQHLFGMEVVHPVTQDHQTPLKFVSRITLPPELTADQRSQLWTDLESLFELAIFRIGKTKARARFQLQADNPQSETSTGAAMQERFASTAEPVEGKWVLVLQSPALILNSREVHDRWNQGIDSTFEFYQRYFEEVSQSTLTLVNSFTEESLQGGFLAYRSDAATYRPFLTTQPGSVFVLEANSESKEATDQTQTRARDLIQTWLQSGLPEPQWAIDVHGKTFQTNPYLRSEGFGEIAVNMSELLALAPEAAEIKLL